MAWWFHTRGTPVSLPIAAIPAIGNDAAASIDAASHAAPPTVLRHIAADERKRLAEQIATARAQPRPAAPSLGSAAEQAAVDDVRDHVMAVHKDIQAFIETCEHFAPDLHAFKTDITLVSDPDIGTLVEANEPVLTQAGATVPQAFSDCLRGEFQTLELPPLAAGDSFKVSFELETDSARD